MNTRHLTIIAAIALIAIAAIGIGYAYQASTEIADNEVSAKYLVIDPQKESSTESSKWSGNLDDFSLYFDTVSTAGDQDALVVTYTLNTTDTETVMYYDPTGKKVTTSSTAGATKVYRIGTQSIILTPATGDTLPGTINFTLSEKVTNESGIGSGYSVFYSIGTTAKANDNAAANLGTAIESVNVGSGDTITLVVDVYVAMTTDYTGAGSTTKPTTMILDDVTFEYKAEVPQTI